jgi:SAM-dependent methyltransferase
MLLDPRESSLSETVVVPEPAASRAPEPDHRLHLAGVLVMSFASLLLELALTRLFSVILFYHFAFLAISIALLGLGAGGVFAYLAKTRLECWDTRTLGARIAALNAVLLVVVLEVDLHVPVALELTSSNFVRLSVLYLVSALPFFFTGLFFSVLFARWTSGITHLYAADLTGGALACVAIVPLLNLIGGPNAVLAAAMASAIASAIIWAPTPNWRRFAVTLTAAFVLLIAGNYSGKLVDIVYAKGIRRDQPWVKFARWNAISRVEVDEQGGAQVIVIDADASTYIMNTDPHNWRPDYRQNLMSAAPSVVNVLRPRGAYAIIGPGGGVDVLRALANGSTNVTGIEINSIIVNQIMRGGWAGWSYHLYDRPEVHMHVGDGRSWVRNAKEKFDVVQMTLVDTWASTAAGAFALSENNLYTVEAFREYFDHLKPDGIIAITRWEFKRPREALRVVSQEIEVLRRAGITDGSSHFIVVSEGELNEDGRPVAVLFKKAPFSPQEKSAVRAHLTENSDLHALYMPGETSERTDAAAAFGNLILSGDPVKFAASYAYNVAPVTDNAPFFFFTIKTGDVLRGIVRGSGRGMDWRINLGVVVLGMVLVISFAAVLLFLILPLLFSNVWRPTRLRATRTRTTPLLYFIAIGLGYILAEIAFIQRFVLFLGHPTYALTVVIFLMLLASGAGSLLSRRWLFDPLQVRTALVVVVALLLAYIWVLPPLLRAMVGLPFLLKLMISALALVPLGLAMGMPFPSGLRALASAGAGEGNAIEWAWALNAASSVLGSVLAMVIAIQFGLSWTLACGALAYMLALALVPRLGRLSQAA